MPEKRLPINKDVLDRIGTTLRKKFDETEKQRQLYREEEWLESLRQFKGIYDDDTLTKIATNKSRVYPRYTRSKVQPCVAKLNNMLFPDNDKNWELRVTPEPRLSQEQIDEIVQALPTVDEEGNPREVTSEEIDEAVMLYAKSKVARMSVTMEDQLTELKYRQKAKAMIRSGVMFGTGILKGPLAKSKKSRVIERTADGFTQQEKVTYMPFVDDVSLWSWFPDMSSTSLEHCDFVFELHSMTKHELRNLSKRKGFHINASAIKDYIQTNKDGDYKLRQWEIDLRVMKDKENTPKPTNKFEVLEYNGYLDGHELLEAGIIEDEDGAEKDWFVNVWLLGSKVIKAVIHPIPSLTELYHVFYFEKDDSSIFGEGLPRVIRDTQIAICAATRAMLDNAAWVSGPIFEINGDLMPEEDIDDVHPARVFQREGRGVDAQYPAIRIYNAESRLQDYLVIIDKLERNGDMESTLPAFLFGEAAKTTNETSKGISIRASNTNLTINDIVKQFDDTNENFLRALYQWNMKYNPDESIKGDMEIKAVGSASLVAKEARTQALDFFAQGLRPDDLPYIKQREFLEERAKLHDLDPDKILHSESEANQIMESRRDDTAMELEKLKLEGEIRYDNAKAANMEAKAEATTHGVGVKEIESMINALEKLRGGPSGEKRTAEPTQV